MKVYYHSTFKNEEIIPNVVYKTIPCRAFLELHRDKNEEEFDLLYNGSIISSDTRKIDCDVDAELIVKKGNSRQVFTVKPSVSPLSMKYSRAYEQFYYEYREKSLDEIKSIQDGTLKLYAVDQSTEVYDWTDTFNEIAEAFSAFKIICDKPKSHLKSVNEVRPIETVKRIGYESIPYLAAHSEDWLARTASGLKPARLFSRVEDDEYHIYENRVVKTLIDLILGFLRRTEKQLRDQRDQLRGIMNSGVQTGSFGFDVSFQKAVSELMSSDDKGEEYRSKNLELIERLQRQAYLLLRKYRTLRKTRLYRYLNKARTVQNPLNETNILVLDKNYSVIFKLWKSLHHVLIPKKIEDDNTVVFDDLCDDYQHYCMTICGYAAHVLGFSSAGEGTYIRNDDYIKLIIDGSEEGIIKVTLSDIEPREIEIPKSVDLPIAPFQDYKGFEYDGKILKWPNNIKDSDIEAFCGLFKKKDDKNKDDKDLKWKYKELKRLISQAQRSYNSPLETTFVIIPTAVEIGMDSRLDFKTSIEDIVNKSLVQYDREVVIALPICDENEQKVTEYAKDEGHRITIIPLSMFDINSFRRIQNIYYRHILKLDKDSCLNCGGTLRINGNQKICDNCNQLTLIKTTCSEPSCKKEFQYFYYDVTEDTISKMSSVKSENFFQWDSLFQYKDIVNMKIEKGKIRPLCPFCHEE